MKKAFFSIVAITFLCAVAQAQTHPVPTFSEYRVAVKKKRIKAVDFRKEPDLRNFRTRINRAVRDGINFAGHYILAGWGCGTGCTNAVIIDAIKGKTYTPVELAGVSAVYGEGYSDVQLEFRKNSALLIIHGSPGTASEDDAVPTAGDYYYSWKNNSLHLIESHAKN